MKCVICKVGETVKKEVTLTIHRDGIVIVFQGVPAEVCENCGEEYVPESTTKKLLEIAEDSRKKGVRFEIRKFAA